MDAVYIALPNSLHAEYTIRAAKAGVHVLCEKPMATTVDECQRMIDACRDADVKLMIAYRLHFESSTLRSIDLVRRGRIGEPKFFNSSFSHDGPPGTSAPSQTLAAGRSMTSASTASTPRAHLFRGGAEGSRWRSQSTAATQRSREIDESTGALLRFDGERLAAFVTSFNAADVGEFRIVGTQGQISVIPPTNTPRGSDTR